MSGSSSRFPGRAEPAMPGPTYDPYDEPTTMVPVGAQAYAHPGAAPNDASRKSHQASFTSPPAAAIAGAR